MPFRRGRPAAGGNLCNPRNLRFRRSAFAVPPQAESAFICVNLWFQPFGRCRQVSSRYALRAPISASLVSPGVYGAAGVSVTTCFGANTA